MGSWRRVRRASYVQRRACLFVRNKQSATPIVSQFETLPQSLSAAFGQSLVFYSGKTTMLTPEFQSASLIEASVCSCECLLRARDTHVAVITPYSACPGTGGRCISIEAAVVQAQTVCSAAVNMMPATIHPLDSNMGGRRGHRVTRRWWFRLRSPHQPQTRPV